MGPLYSFKDTFFQLKAIREYLAMGAPFLVSIEKRVLDSNHYIKIFSLYKNQVVL